MDTTTQSPSRDIWIVRAGPCGRQFLSYIDDLNISRIQEPTGKHYLKINAWVVKI